jgi:hypothetical protein
MATGGRAGRGLDIGFIGIDGIGKSTLAGAVAEALREHGHDVEVVSWHRYLRPDSDDILGAVYPALIRTLFAGARTAEGDRVLDLLPGDSIADVERLRGLPVAVNEPGTLLASAALELAAQLLHRSRTVEPALAAGRTVVQDGFGIRTVVKLALLASAAGGYGTDRRAARRLVAFATDLLHGYGSPTIGVFVHGSPRLAQEWRLRQRGAVGFAEDLSLAGHPGPIGFVAMQGRAQRVYAAAARSEGWLAVRMYDRPRAENVAAGVATIVAALRARGLLMSERTGPVAVGGAT